MLAEYVTADESGWVERDQDCQDKYFSVIGSKLDILKHCLSSYFSGCCNPATLPESLIVISAVYKIHHLSPFTIQEINKRRCVVINELFAYCTRLIYVNSFTNVLGLP